MLNRASLQVCGAHSGTLNRFRWMMRTRPLSKEDVFAHKTTLNFVDSVWEVTCVVYLSHSHLTAI